MAKKLLSTSCPYCDLPMQTEVMACLACEVKIEGPFAENVINKLPVSDQQFLEEYLLAGFSIKALEQNSALGYAAIRSRLDRLIENYQRIKKADAQKKAVLEQLRTGQITVAQAKQKLQKISGA